MQPAPLTHLQQLEAESIFILREVVRADTIPHFTGISAPYEAPEQPELHIETTRVSAQAAADQIVAYLGARGFLSERPA